MLRGAQEPQTTQKKWFILTAGGRRSIKNNLTYRVGAPLGDVGPMALRLFFAAPKKHSSEGRKPPSFTSKNANEWGVRIKIGNLPQEGWLPQTAF